MKGQKSADLALKMNKGFIEGSGKDILSLQ
jgi:hypothetical protein